MRKSPRLMATLNTLFGLWLALALATVPGCGPAGDDASAPTAAAPPGEVATTESPLAIGGGGGSPGIRGCTTNCNDSFVRCAQSGADWHVCQSIYNICVLLCGISGAPVSGGGSIASVADAPSRAVGSATSEQQ